MVRTTTREGGGDAKRTMPSARSLFAPRKSSASNRKLTCGCALLRLWWYATQKQPQIARTQPTEFSLRWCSVHGGKQPKINPRKLSSDCDVVAFVGRDQVLSDNPKQATIASKKQPSFLLASLFCRLSRKGPDNTRKSSCAGIVEINQTLPG